MVKLFGKQGGEVTLVTGGMVQISKDGHGVTVIVIGHALGNGNTQVLFKEGKCKNVFCLLSKISTLTIGIFQSGILEYCTSGWFPCRCGKEDEMVNYDWFVVKNGTNGLQKEDSG